MGADMTVALAALPHYDDEAQTLLGMYADEHQKGAEFWYEASRLVGIRRITELKLGDDDLMNTIYDDDEATVIDLRRRLQHASRDLTQRNREVAVITVAGRRYMVSGGMSWGDPPTDACDALDLIGYFDLFDEPITQQELNLVLTSGVAECGTCHLQFPDIYPSARCPFEYEHTTEGEEE
jgi:hypothetical protein